MPIVPTYNGVPVFGWGAEIIVEPNETRLQLSSYNGVHGQDCITLGSTGYYCETNFLQTADNPTLLALYEIMWRNFVKYAYAYPLLDTLGETWINAIVVKFRPTEKVQPHGPFGAVSRSYFARFEILS